MFIFNSCQLHFYVVFMIGKSCGNHLENSNSGKSTSRMIRLKIVENAPK